LLWLARKAFVGHVPFYQNMAWSMTCLGHHKLSHDSGTLRSRARTKFEVK
jgi:hypothetical protein